MEDIDPREIFDDIGKVIYEMEPELTELIEEGSNEDIIQKLIKLGKDAKELKECVYKEFYKDEM